MKKIKNIIIVLSAAVFCLMMAVSCGKTALSAPQELTMDLNYVLTWKTVANARRYEINAVKEDGTSYPATVNTPTYDMSKLTDGNYEVTVRAIPGDSVHDVSEWSESFAFTRAKETGCTYKLINNNTAYEISRCPASITGDMVIEEIYRGKPVIRIAQNAFKGSKIENLVIGKNITYIGDGAFYNSTRLKSVVIPDSVNYIGEKVFQNCRSLVTINIPKAVSEIKTNTFINCSSLTTITIPDSVTAIGEGAFRGCKALKTIVIPDSVKTIGGYAFADTVALTGVTIGKSVKVLGEYAFYRASELSEVKFAAEGDLTEIARGAFADNVKLTEIVIPEGVESIGDGCFFGDKLLASVTLPESLKSVGVTAFNASKYYTDIVDDNGKARDKNKPFVYVGKWIVAVSPDVVTTLTDISGNTVKLKNVSNAITIVGHDNVVGIADGTFSNFTELTSVTLPDSLRYVGNSAFSNCQKLTKFIATKVKTIGDYAFDGCKVLGNVRFIATALGGTQTSNLETIGSYAFRNCSQLKNNTQNNLFVPDTVKKIGTRAFYNSGLWTDTATHQQGLIYAGNWIVGYSSIPSGTIVIDEGRNKPTVGIADYAFYKCEGLQELVNLNSLNIRSIGRGAFYECTSLVSAKLGNNISEIQPFTFYGCVNLTRIELSRNLTTIGERAFYGCSYVRDLDFSRATNLESIGERAFYACRSLRNLNLGNSVKIIGDYAFYNMNDDGASNTSLKTLVIPDSVTTVGANAFANLKALESLTIGSGVTAIGDYAFKNCTALGTLVIPDNVVKLGKSAFYKCTGVTTLELGNGLTDIGAYAFYGMDKIEYIVLPESVENIGKFAFKGWSVITSIILDKDIETIGAHAFYGEKAATFYSDAEGIMPEWEKTWNSSYSAVIWNCTLSEDKSYVVSVEIKENGISNRKSKNGISAPLRKGYEFVGWSVSADSDEIAFAADEIVNAENGVTLYAVWRAVEQ